METLLYYSPLFLFVLGLFGWTLWYACKTIASHPRIHWARALLLSFAIGTFVGTILGGVTYIGTGISAMDTGLRLAVSDLTGMIAAWSLTCTLLCFVLLLRNMSLKPPR